MIVQFYWQMNFILENNVFMIRTNILKKQYLLGRAINKNLEACFIIL